MTDGRPSRIRYFNRGEAVQNFGDFIPQLFEDRLVLQPRLQADVYRLIGSVIEADWLLRDLRHTIGTERGIVAYWGCGMRRAEPMPATVARKALFCGIRGVLSRDAMRLPAETPLGDPGLLVPLLHDLSPNPRVVGKTVCIPHIHDTRSSEDFLRMSGAEQVLPPSVDASEAALRNMFDSIASAEFVLSASLHGAIIAAAYGRPFAFWDNGYLDCPFKWEDFASSIGIACHFASSMRDAPSLHALSIKPHLTLPPLWALLDCCPFHVRPDVLVRALAHDGLLSARAADEVSARLAGLPSMRDAELQRTDRWNQAHFDRLSHPFQQLWAGTMRAKERAKRAVRLAIGLR